MKVRTREKIQPIRLRPNDTIELSYQEPFKLEVVVLKERVGRKLTVDEAVVFDIEPGDIDNAEDGLGGAFIKSKEEQHGDKGKDLGDK